TTRLLARRDPSGLLRIPGALGISMPGIDIIVLVNAKHSKYSIILERGTHHPILSLMLRHEVDVTVLPDIPADPRFRRLPILQQNVVAIVSETHPLAAATEVQLRDLAQQALIFRSRGSSTQKVIDRAFARAGLAPRPRLIADTRDAVYEAVSLGIGVGFMWRLGTHRADAVRRLQVPNIGSGSEEIVFALAEERNPLTDMFFLAAESYTRRLQEQILP